MHGRASLVLDSHENRGAADCSRTVKNTPLVRIYNKGAATIRVVLREFGSGVEVWLIASEGMRRHERFAGHDAAAAFQAQIHDTLIDRRYRLVWNGDGAAGDDAA